MWEGGNAPAAAGGEWSMMLCEKDGAGFVCLSRALKRCDEAIIT